MDVLCGGAPWGRAEITELGGTVRFRISGPLRTDAVYRIWGRAEGREPLLLGVPEPHEDRLVLERTRSRSELALFGYGSILPEQYVLSVHEPEWNAPGRTGDELLDEIIRTHRLYCERTGEMVRIRCRFDKDTEFPLAFVFCLCRIENGEAVLEWTQKQTEPQCTVRSEK